MREERLGFSGETQVADKGEGVKAQFTQAGLPSLFPIEDFAISLADDNLRDILSGIRPLRQKSVKALKTEEVNKMPIEPLIFRSYWVDNKSALETGRMIGWSPDGILRIMRRAGIPRRDASTARKVQYEDPRRKEEILAKTHTLESTQKRSMSMARWHREHPEASIEMKNNSYEAIRKNLAQQEQGALGLYPSFALFQMHYIEGYSVLEISQKTGLKESTVRALMKKHGVKNLDRPLESDSKHQAEVNESIDVFYKKEAALNPDEEYVIYRRYIASEYKRVTLREVGTELEVSHEKVRQIEERAAKKLSMAATKQEG